ncbi:hypothetical protein RJ639_013889 [Escallonia herrerae]|uniref:Prolamin-like domain-containing protein n=1 Tax=Escallonia herrerae TaxID=1293975 RepID=A0AA88VJZ5_9ASTE|nr:hypothetical protein RJ639_013889 [Escallonia herrerae]
MASKPTIFIQFLVILVCISPLVLGGPETIFLPFEISPEPSPEPSREPYEELGVEECFAAIGNSGDCISKIFRAYREGQVANVGPVCCNALRAVDDACWPKMFPFDPFFPPFVKGFCAIYRGDVPHPSMLLRGFQHSKMSILELKDTGGGANSATLDMTDAAMIVITNIAASVFSDVTAIVEGICTLLDVFFLWLLRGAQHWTTSMLEDAGDGANCVTLDMADVAMNAITNSIDRLCTDIMTMLGKKFAHTYKDVLRWCFSRFVNLL